MLMYKNSNLWYFSIGAAIEIEKRAIINIQGTFLIFCKLYLEFRWVGLFAIIDSSQLSDLSLKKKHGDLLWIVVKNLFEFY